MARVPHIPSEELPERYDVIEQEDDLHEDIDAEWWNTKATVQTFANNSELAKVHVYANVLMWTKSGLTPEEVELVILSVARAIDSDYIWHAHVIAAIERTELTAEAVLSISRGEMAPLADSAQALIQYALEFARSEGRVSDETYGKLAEHYDNEVLVGTSMLAAYYVFIQYVANALQLALEEDEEFVGWELENY